MELLIKVAQLFLSLSILVILHELGHFIPAKLFKTRVEKFYLFFDPWFSLFKFKKGGTEYGIGWLPLGGYVKISGMIDESMDKEQMKKEPQDWEFRAKPAWQRLIIMVGGVTVNLILAFFIYSMILFTWGKEYLPIENANNGLVADSVLLANGFQKGDIILQLGGVVPKTYQQAGKAILIGGETDVMVRRNGRTVSFQLPDYIEDILIERGVRQLFSERIPFIVDSIIPGEGAANSALQKGDKIVGINDIVTPYFDDFVEQNKNFKNKNADIIVEREGELMPIGVKFNQEGIIGVAPKGPHLLYNTKIEEYGFFASFPAGWEFSKEILSNYVLSLRFMFTSSGAKQMGGFGTFTKMFSPTWDWANFWEMTALISIILAVMNILPIPALDGGHVVFLLYEMISGRKPNEKVMEYAQLAGMILLLGLFVYANGMDVFRALQ